MLTSLMASVTAVVTAATTLLSRVRPNAIVFGILGTVVVGMLLSATAEKIPADVLMLAVGVVLGAIATGIVKLVDDPPPPSIPESSFKTWVDWQVSESRAAADAKRESDRSFGSTIQAAMALIQEGMNHRQEVDGNTDAYDVGYRNGFESGAHVRMNLADDGPVDPDPRPPA